MPRTPCNSTSTDPVEFIRDATGGFGADVCIEAVGNPAVYRQAFDARDLAGTVVLVGVPRPDMTIELPFLEVFGHGGALKSSWYGDCLPSRDFPMLVDLYLQGRLDLDGFVSETIGLDAIEDGVREDGARRGAPQRRGALADGDRAGHDRRHLRPRRRRVGGHEQHLDRRRRPRGRRVRCGPRSPADRRRRATVGGSRPSC